MAKGDRGGRGRREYGRTERERGSERRDKENRSRENRERAEKREARRQKLAEERAAEKAAPKRGSKEELENRQQRQKEWQRDWDRKREERRKEREEEDKSMWDNFSDKVSGFFSGEEDTAGFSPMGGSKSYGMSKQNFDKTVGERRHKARSLGQRMSRQVDYFQEAPLDYVSDLLDNPFISAGVMMSGLGIPAFGIKVVDAITDIYQNEETPLGALGNIGAGALSFTGVGASLPSEIRGIAKAGLKEGIEGATMAGAGTLGGKVGTGLGSKLADVFTDNPMAKVGITAAGAAAGAFGAQKGVQTAMVGAPSGTSRGPVGMEPDRPGRGGRDGGGRESPLVSSGRESVQASRELMKQTQPVDLYAQTVKTLPYYGLAPELSGQDKQPYYGV